MNIKKYFLIVTLVFSSLLFTQSASAENQYTALQCSAIGGMYSTNCDDPDVPDTNKVDAGAYLNAACNPSGRCCAPTATPPTGPACVASTCEAIGGACMIACGGDKPLPSDGGTCSEAGKLCCIPGGGQPAPTGKGLQYQLLEKIPGTDGLGSDLPGYVSAIYKMALVIVTLSAVLMLSIGGFMYLTSAGNTASIGTAKGIIYDSLIGLIIALSAWLVLYVINPDLVEINLSGLSPVAPVGGNPAGAPGAVGALPTGSDIELATKILSSGNITLQASGSCLSPTGQISPKRNIEEIANGKKAAKCSNECAGKGSAGCTDNAINLSNKMLAAILAVGVNNRFTITSIGGGSHATNSKHFVGSAIDITPVNQGLLDAFVTAGAFPPSGNSASMCELNGKNVGCNGGGNHIHLVFPN